MLSSIRQSDKKKVYAGFIEKNPTESYNCEYCGAQTIHHKSKAMVRVPHFQHKAKDSDCPNNALESEIHLKTKLDIYKYLLKEYEKSFNLIEVEKWILKKHIRPDIYLETRKGNKIAIEVQKTALKVDEISYRTEKYFANNIYVLWVLPFEKGRFWKYQQLHTGYSIMDQEWGYTYAEKVKLKEMELWLSDANNDKLICWDLDHRDSDSFVCVFLGDHKGADREYSIGREEYYSYGRVSKTFKTVSYIKYDVFFSDFEKGRLNGFRSNRRGYYIPERLFLKLKK